jgi:hypothetical protein
MKAAIDKLKAPAVLQQPAAAEKPNSKGISR